MPSVVRFNLVRSSGVSAKRGLNLDDDRGGTGSRRNSGGDGCEARQEGGGGLNVQDNPRFKAFQQ